VTEANLLIQPVMELGPLTITGSVVTTWAIITVIWLGAWLLSRRLRNDPGRVQTAVEGVVSAIEEAVTAVEPRHSRHIMPFIGTLWVFLVIANLVRHHPGPALPDPRSVHHSPPRLTGVPVGALVR
jgi:F-type H+-transporting ATPase subunit a